MIAGENLYNVWHTYSEDTRKHIVKQLCDMLRLISSVDVAELAEYLEPVASWKAIVLKRIEKYTAICSKAGTLTTSQVQKIKQFCSKYSDCLDEQRIALVYRDAHFDNILVKDSVIVGLLDFERTELASIDFMLDIVKRMVEFPKKYMSEYAEQFAKDEDYAQLLDWYKEYYYELFDLEQLDRRLDLYSLAHDLEDLENWPSVQTLKDNIDKVLSES
jgi:aminoglycoside phosphotransferase (APT) family kinase protein